MRPERVVLKPYSTDLKFERADLRSERADTLFSKASDTSKTFVVPKRLILRNPGWLHLKEHKLPFFHVKF